MDLPSLPAQLQGMIEIQLPGGFVFAPSYLQAGLIVFLVFLLILTLGMLQHRYMHWTIKGVMPGFSLGFVFALLIEAILIASGSTILVSVLGWKDAPKPLSNVLDAGKTRLVDVLGETDENKSEESSSGPSKATIGQIMSEYQELNDSEQESLRSLVCKP